MTLRGWVDNDHRAEPIEIDPSTFTLQTMTYGHHEVHEGNHFGCDDVQAVDTEVQKWMINVPDDAKWPHMNFGIESTGEMEVLVREGADRNGSIEQNIVNHNRNSSNTSVLSIYRGVEGGSTDGSATIAQSRSGSSQGATNAVGNVAPGHEYVLQQNTKYVVSVETFSSVHVTFEPEWYEHEDKV